MRNPSMLQPIAAALVCAGVALGPWHFACAQSVKVEFPAKPDPTELPEVWPEEVGVESAPLIKLSQWIRDQKLDIRSLVIVKDGKIAFERYSDGLTRDNNYELYSITKALTAILAGDLIAEGKISLDSSVKDVIGAYRPDLNDAVADKGNVKLRNVLGMTTGLYYDFKPPNDPIYYEAPDRLKLAATTKPLLVPGKVFPVHGRQPDPGDRDAERRGGREASGLRRREGVQAARHEALRLDPG
jgi:CubicO group peptidase (beta-lactamase class C family)